MSFDALTIVGLFAALLSGGFLVAVVSHDDRAAPSRDARPPEPATVAAQD